LPTLKKTLWMLNRLASMSPPEVMHRFGERRRRGQGRKYDGWDALAAGWGRFVPFDLDLDELTALADTCRADWQGIAKAYGTGRWTYLGQEWPGRPYSESIHLDPVSGQRWESDAYCFDIDFRHRSGIGDIKYVWELNRLQFLVPMAALARADADRALARSCYDAIFAWADANPPYRGVNWNSGIELALRAITIVAVTSLLGVDSLSDAQKDRLATIINAHALWLDRYPSLYSSANNHLIAEGAGLYVIGALLPDLPNADHYRSYGRRVLEEEATKQIHPDGVGAEQSPTYTSFTIELYATALAAAQTRGEILAPVVTEQLRRAGEFLSWITDGQGNQPRFGDDDEGRVFLSLPGHEGHYVASVMNAIAAISGHQAIAAPIVVPHLRDLFLGQEKAASGLPTGFKSFDAGGYSVFRDEIAGHEAMFVIDHGPLGYLSIAAHGHADALAVWLHLDGCPVFIDAGTYLYHSGGDMRDRFRGTVSHNTLQVNGLDQSTIVGAFNWSQKARAWRVETDDPGCVLARHDGYRRRVGVIHERGLRRQDSGYQITDRLDGPLDRVKNTVLRYYLAPDIAVSLADVGRAVLSRSGSPLLEVSMVTPTGEALAMEVVAVETSPRFGVKEKSVALVADIPVSLWRQGAITTRLALAKLESN
jgi:hypothetical protein